MSSLIDEFKSGLTQYGSVAKKTIQLYKKRRRSFQSNHTSRASTSTKVLRKTSVPTTPKQDVKPKSTTSKPTPRTRHQPKPKPKATTPKEYQFVFPIIKCVIELLEDIEEWDTTTTTTTTVNDNAGHTSDDQEDHA